MGKFKKHKVKLIGLGNRLDKESEDGRIIFSLCNWMNGGTLHLHRNQERGQV